jgi:DNA mismatch repair protein MutS2
VSASERLDLDRLSRQALEFDALLEIVAADARTDAGKRSVRALSPLTARDELERENKLVSEVRRWLVREGGLVPGNLPDARETLDLLRVVDAKIRAASLRELCSSLVAIGSIRSGVLNAGHPAERLKAFVEPLPDLGAESSPILAAVEPDGRIADHASKRLAECRARRSRLAGRLRRKLETLLRDPRAVGVIQDEFVTRRNGRFVIPVRTDAPQPVRGIVHATSSSGATRFVEPLDSVDLNNELVELAEAEREEEERIARAWADGLRARLPDVEVCLIRLADLDAFQARARYAERVGAVEARIEPGGPIRLRGLRHPLLERHLEQSGGRCIPLDLDLDPADRILVVSGPNTGGKTVALKSLGLAVLMAQSGIPVTAVEAALPLFEQVRSDVGDHQSIAADLSTFSGHVTAMSAFLEARHPPALFLFDEIGAGTDPAEGAALALAVLEHLAGPNVTIVATTHQNALKHWAFGDERAASAAMEFDDRTLRPTYRVLPNVVGHSAALDIAARCGLPDGLIDRARELLGEDAGRSEAYLNKLRERLAELDEERAVWSEKQREVEEERAAQRRRARDREERGVAEMERGLDRELVSFRKQIRRALSSIEDIGARRTAEKTAHATERRLKLERERAVRSLGSAAVELNLPKPDALEEGLTVHVQSLGRQGTIRRIDGQRVELVLGRIGVTVDADDLRVPATRASSPPRQARSEAPARDLETGAPTELMLVGQRVDSALEAIDRFLDHAVLDAVHEVRLIHGHGTGRLRRAVREHLREHVLVRDYRSGGKGEGGAGATVARLK